MADSFPIDTSPYSHCRRIYDYNMNKYESNPDMEVPTEDDFKNWISPPIGPDGTSEEPQIINYYVSCLNDGIYKFPDLLRDMEPYLTEDSDLITVARALAIFPHILSSLRKQLGLHETNALVEYFCARLDNRDKIPNYRAGIYEVASSLELIVKWKRFVPGGAAPIATAIFSLANGSTFKDQKPTTRVKLYQLVEYIFKSFQAPLIRDLTVANLVQGLVSMAELEKNPSCLAVLFPLYSYISINWPLEDSDFEVIWESFIRYFPVTLGGVPHDPSVPAKGMIKHLLLQCILSSASYAQWAVPRFLDMLDTNIDLSANVKLEVLDTLEACIESYPAATTSQWSSKIWDSLKFEVWNGENGDFIQGALEVLAATTKSLGAHIYSWTLESNEEKTNRVPIESNWMIEYVVPAATECRDRFNDSKKLYLVSTGKILGAIAKHHPYAFHLVAKTVLPSMYSMWKALKLPSEKKMLLTVYNDILEARMHQPETHNQYGNMATSFNEFRDSIIEIYSNAISSIQLEDTDLTYGKTAVEGLVLLFQIPSFLSAVEQGMIVQELNKILWEPSEHNSIHQDILSALAQLSAEEPSTFQDITLTNFMDKLPDALSSNPKQREEELEVVIGLLQDLVSITCHGPCHKEGIDRPAVNGHSSYEHRNFDAMETKLLGKLDQVLAQGQLDYANAILAAICGGLQLFDANKHRAGRESSVFIPLDPKTGPYTYIVMALFEKVVEQKELPGAPEWRYTGIKEPFDDTFIQMVGRTAMLALRSDLTTPQNNFLLNWNRAFPNEQSVIWTLFTHSAKDRPLSSPQDLSKGPRDKCLANALSMYLLAGYRVERASDLYRQITKSIPKNMSAEPRDLEINGTMIKVIPIPKAAHTPISELRFEPSDIAVDMIRNAISDQSGATSFGRMCMLWMLQLLVSKYAASATSIDPLFVMTKAVTSILRPQAGTPKPSNQVIKNTLQTLIYFTAAALACFDPHLPHLINQLISLLSSSTHGRYLAQSFRLLLSPSPILLKENGCTIHALRFQKALTLLVLPLSTKYYAPSTSKLEKDNIVIALAGVLHYISPQIIAESSFGFSRIMLEGTAVSGEEFTKETFIRLLLELIPLCPKEAEEHLDTVIRLMTDRTRNTYTSPSDASARCRVLALDVLARLTEGLPVATLLMRRSRLLPELDLALDDCSRDVRGKAQITKMKWLHLGKAA